MARDGMRVLVLEKNQYVGGMAATTELIRGYRYEIAGSVLFPVPDEIFDFLDLGSCPTLEPEVMSVNVGEPGTPPMMFYADPERLMNLFLSSTGCYGGPGVTFIPGYNAGFAALDAFPRLAPDAPGRSPVPCRRVPPPLRHARARRRSGVHA